MIVQLGAWCYLKCGDAHAQTVPQHDPLSIELISSLILNSSVERSTRTSAAGLEQTV